MTAVSDVSDRTQIKPIWGSPMSAATSGGFVLQGFNGGVGGGITGGKDAAMH